MSVFVDIITLRCKFLVLYLTTLKYSTYNIKMSGLSALHTLKQTGAKQTATLIFFHGSGSTGPYLMDVLRLMVKNFSFPHIKILFPTAPLQPYTPAGGQKSTVWFDREYVSPEAPENQNSIANIEEEVKNLIRKENEAGIPSNRIIAGGFSMGGALAMHVGYHWDMNLAGVFVLSSFLNQKSVVYDALRNAAGQKFPPLLQIQGNNDDIVDFKWGHDTYESLKALGVQGEFHVEDRLGHTVNRRVIAMLKDWIEKILPENESEES